MNAPATELMTCREDRGAPRTLLVTGTLPGTAGVGAIILRDLLADMPKGSVCCVAAVRRGTGTRSSQDRDCQADVVFERRFETAYRPVRGLAGEIVSAVVRRALFRRHVAGFVTQATASGQRHAVELVWAVLDCPTTILAARDVAGRLGVPLVVLVWDPPEVLAAQLNHDRFTRSALLSEFESTMRFADRCGVVGESMKARYDAAYGQQCVIVRHGLASSRWREVRSRTWPGREVRVGYAGSITAPGTFRTLVQMLDSRGWELGGRDVVLRLIGARHQLNPRGPQRIEYYGWRSVDETVTLLSECNLLYLPQSFSERLRPLAELSFPTKLSTYLAAGRPVLLHAPHYASVAPFFERYPFGVWCRSMELDTLASALCRLAVPGADVDQTCRHVERARQEELNADVFRRRFRQLLGLEQGERATESSHLDGPELDGGGNGAEALAASTS